MIKVDIVAKYPANLDAIVLRVMEGKDQFPISTQAIDNQLKGAIRKEVKALGFRGRVGDTAVLGTIQNAPAHRIILAGVGKSPVSAEQLRVAGASAIRQAASLNLKSIATPVTIGTRLEPTVVAASLAEGSHLADYRFNKYLKNKREKTIRLVLVAPKDTRQVSRAASEAGVRARAVNLARDLVNEPPSVMNPVQLAREAKKVALQGGLRVRVMGPAEMKRIGLNATLAVAKGSDVPAQFIRLQYIPAKAKKHVVLVGKGVTFDTGGINLKPSNVAWLEIMKIDMGGSAAVIGAMSALRDLGVTSKVTAYIPATENMINGSAYKPGDIVKTYDGTSVEVSNTDAEGRLTLADALSYAIAKDKPDEIVDIATLTGAVVAALGTEIGGLMSNNEALKNRIQTAAKTAGENIWELPLHQPYNETLQTPIADVKSLGVRFGGGLVAGLFLERFVGKTPWVHLDIAGPAWSEKDAGYIRKGGTGFGVRTLLDYLRAS